MRAPEPERPTAHAGDLRKLGSAAAALALIAVVWLVVLPGIGRLPAVRRHSDAMRAGEIEASAMFYTELNWTPPTGPVWRRATTGIR
jgi:hypothetical protein